MAALNPGLVVGLEFAIDTSVRIRHLGTGVVAELVTGMTHRASHADLGVGF